MNIELINHIQIHKFNYKPENPQGIFLCVIYRFRSANNMYYINPIYNRNMNIANACIIDAVPL
jgi:hypothetical protein